MTIFASDTFGSADGTDIETHDSNWSENSAQNGGQGLCDGSNRCKQAGGNLSIYYRDEAPASADYSTQMDIDATADGSAGLGIYAAVRCASSAETLYIFGQNWVAWRVFRGVSGSYTQLGSSTSETLSSGSSYNGVKIDVATSGSDAVLTTTVGGTGKCGSPITDTSPITATGAPGFYLQDLNSGRPIRISDFQAEEVAAGGGGNTLFLHTLLGVG